MHMINKLGAALVIDNTNRVRQILSREITNPIPEDVNQIRLKMLGMFNNDFVNDLFTVFSRLNHFEIPSRDALYDMLRNEPFICVVVENDENDSGYPVNTPLLVMQNGQNGLQMPSGEYGGHVPRAIRLATDEEIIGLSIMVTP